MPLVSVVIPSYRHAAFIEECVRSALSQTLSDLEVIVVDDAGGDGSADLVRAIADPRVKVFENERNLGAYSTLNVVLGHATGEWVAVLNSDDRWLPGKLEAQLELLRTENLLWSYTLGRQIDAQGEEMAVDQHQDWPTDAVQDLTPFLLSSNRILASSVVFRRGAARWIEGLNYCGDWMLALRLARQFPAGFVNETLTDWRQHGANSYLPSDKLVAEEMLVRMSLEALKLPRPLQRGEVGELANRVRGLSAEPSQNALHLSALLALADHMHEARQWAALSGNRKRQLLCALPGPLARKRLWGDSTARKVALPSELLDLHRYFTGENQ